MIRPVKMTLGVLLAAAAGLIAAVCKPALADNAAVLPEGVSRAYVDFYHYLPTTQRYNAAGEREDLAFPFTNATLDGNALSGIGLPGSAILGDVAVDYEYDIDVLDFGYSYGVSESLSIGIHLPYYWISNNVDTEFDATGANVGLDGGGNCCIPGGLPLSEQDVQDLIVANYGFGEIDNWSREGIGDIELGARYRFYAEADSALALTSGLRIPTGYEDDADKLNDVAWSYGNYALLLRLHYDYLLSNLWQQTPSSLERVSAAPGDLVLNLTLRYDYMLPDDRIARVGDTPDQTFSNNRERVERELGDLYNVELAAKYQATPALALSLVYSYAWKAKDRISGDMGFNYASLEADTDSKQEIAIVKLEYSTLPGYQKRQSGVPLEISIAYRERIAGEGPRSGQANPVLHTSWLVIGLDLFF